VCTHIYSFYMRKVSFVLFDTQKKREEVEKKVQ
jgi:hypothetical protein